MGFYALSLAWLFTLVVPTVVLYFLKLKRPRQAVPSLVLWRQVLADNRVNSPFQKFKRNLLLLFQLILLSFLILGAMQPYIRSGDEGVERILVLLDRSASMAALDKEGGTSRLDAAKARLRETVDALSLDQEMSIIAFSSSARQAVPFTSNKRLLLNEIDKLQPEDVASDLTDALRMAEAAHRTTRIERVILLTDGNVPPSVDFDLPFKLEFQKVQPPGPNIGITALSARRAPREGWKVFAKIEGAKGSDIPATLELIQDGQPRGKERIVLDSTGERRIVFPIDTESRTSLELRLTPESFDSLPTDNTAFLELAPARPLTVYASPSLGTYRHALEGIRGLTIYPREGQPPPTRYDLIIADATDPVAAQAPTRLRVGAIPPELTSMIQVTKGSATIVDWRRAAPLLEHVEMSDITFVEQTRWLGPAGEESLENLRFEVMVYGPKGPMLLQRQSPGRTEYHLLVHSDRSTLPYRVGFPIFVSNLVRIAMQESGLLEVHGDRAGVLPPVNLLPSTAVSIDGPAGYRREQTTTETGLLSGIPATRVGRYTVRSGGEEKARAGVSLLQRDETLLATTDQLQLSELKVAAALTPVKSDRSLWSLLAWLALAVLAVEWWYYQRKP